MFIFKRILFLLVLLILLQLEASAQKFGNALRPIGKSNANGESKDSLQRRDQNADSITLFYKLYNNNEIRKLDSSINDFFVHYPLPYTNYNLGNLGTASKSYLFSMQKKGGFDAGFHAYDAYNYTLAATPFYQTTRPFTELGYLLGGKGEQLIEVKHTQNKTQQLNFSFEYRFSNSPGNVKNQNANLNNMRITAHFQSKRKRYESYFVMLTNKAASSENGGLVKASLLDSLALNNPYELETRLGVSGASFRNPFNTTIATGSTYKNNTYLWRQTYDLGQKDSIVKDTVVIYLFYPRLRFQNEVKLESNQFVFEDRAPNELNYLQYFNYQSKSNSNYKFVDNWNLVTNDFSLISYPQKNNSNQFLQVGSGYSHLATTLSNLQSWSDYDLYGFGVYKNKTRNQLWDLLASGKLYLNGYHAGDYDAQFYLSRILNSKGTYLKIAFQNSNRTPSTNYLGLTQFPINALKGIKKENTIDMNGELGNAAKGFRVSFNYQLINNYNYFSSGFQAAVYTKPISYISTLLSNKIKISKHWNWYNETTVQVVDKSAPINIPFILSRQRLAFEGNFYKNLNLSTGLEMIYHTDFKADDYMPLTGQFFVQNSYMLQNRPTANAFLHFMIKRFKGYIRLENLNTLIPTSNSLGNTYNFTAKNYPGTGTWFRVGIWWNFIN
ncbi:MAG: hypothetical protein EXR19_02000 [Chitinophagaceae bacterium]|nr:hypothetical protein [Chitinophagaceae bacterium]